MKRLGLWLLYAIVGAAFFYGGAMVSMRASSDAAPNLSTDASTAVPLDRASGPPPGYEPPAPEDTPCLQSEYVARCIGRATARRGLMELAGLQAQRKRDRGAYAERAGALGFSPERGMELRMRADAGGWTAEYHHTAAGVGCAVYDGDVEDPFTTISGALPASSGAVACDDPLDVER